MRSYIWFVLSLFYVHLCIGQSTVRITFKDSISHEPISFLLVENAKDSFSDFTNLDGAIRLPSQKQKVIYQLSHIAYGNRYIHVDVSKNSTLYLPPVAIGMSEVVVSDVRRDIEAMLTDVLKHLRKDKTVHHNQYAFYLETKHKGKRFEKIKAVFDATYNHSEGIKESQMMDGEFWFNPDSLFVNLDLDTWLLNFNPLAKKSSEDLFYLMSNVDKIKAKKHRVVLMECDNCPDGYEHFSMDNEQHSIRLIANLQEKKVANCQVTIKPRSKLFFINLISEDTTRIEGVDINYLYGSDGNLDKLVFKLRLNDRLHRALSVDGFFTKVNYEAQKEMHYFGNYRPTTLYEKILMDPAPNRYRIDTLYDEADYDGYKINNSSGLWSNDENMRDYFFAKNKFNKNILLWSKARKLNASNVRTNNEYTVSLREASVPELKADVTWIYSYDKKSAQWRSIPSIWSSNSTLSHIDKASYAELAMELAFDRMELSRKSYTPSDAKALATYFNEQLSETMTNMNLLLEDRLPLKKLYTYSAVIEDEWGLDNVFEAYKREIPIMLKQPKMKSLAYRFSSEAFDQHYKGDTTMSRNFSKMAVKMYLHLLDEYKDKMNHKMLGGTHYILADQYYLLQIKEDACMHFESALKIWPEANQTYPKLTLMELCDVK